ncbi:MAG: hypothetical protein M1401_19115 [Chloroflexi bacterium]|nr:hypothetical protein [Chloroflexota bacterium]MCL5110931.1 hypothetical protein [Chloroflexota bacterium]
MRQVETELQQLAPKRSEREEQVRLVEIDPAAFTPALVREAYAALAEVANRHFLMQVQLDSLRQREQALTLQLGQAEQSSNLLAKIAMFLPDLRSGEAAPPANGGGISHRETARLLVTAREEQRQLLTQQILDGPVTVLSNLVLQAEVGLRLMSRNKDTAMAELKELKDSLAGALGEVKRFAVTMSPPSLPEMGLPGTLRRYLAEVETRTGVAAHFASSGDDMRLPAETELYLFRAAQEALGYLLVGAPPSEIGVSLSFTPHSAQMEVAAAYAGLAPSAGSEQEDLRNLGYYSQACGGKVLVDRPNESNLQIRIFVPSPQPV